MAHPRGFEPLTYRLEGGCSIQLSYGCISIWNLVRRMARDSTNIISRPDLNARNVLLAYIIVNFYEEITYTYNKFFN